ncbi:MAG TPA: BatD family protein [Rubricoccaceae bacterium]|nr:BatD family protein [Rubricoccaceae bacterium]
MLLALLLGRGAAAQVSVNAYVDKTELGDAETLAYTLEIRGDLAGLGPVEAPDARGLALAHPSPVLQERLAVNGDERLTLRWLYRPQGVGKATVLGATVRVGGRAYRTDPITVEVVPQRLRGSPGAPRSAFQPTPVPPPQAASGELFVRAEPRTLRVVPGQQVVVDYVLYFEPHLRPQRSQVVGTWDAEGFWREELEVPVRDTYARPVTVGGRPYQAVTIRRLALFPTRTGRLELGPMTFDVDLVRSARRDDPSDLFGAFFSRFDEASVTAPPVTLTAEPLPPGAPPSFGGAVGRFALRAFTDLDVVTAGEPVHLTVEIEGEGNVPTLAPPAVEAPPGLDVFPPEEDRMIDRSEAPLSGVRRFTYTLAPRGGGTFEIPALAWSYYDPEAGAYRTLEAGPFTVEATGPAAVLAPESAGAGPSAPLGLIGEASWRRAGEGSATFPAWALGAALALPLLALLGLAALRRRADRRADRSPEALALRAHPEARRRLRAARAAGTGPAVHAAVERAVRDFLADRLGIAAHGLARPALLDALAGAGVTAGTRAGLADLLARCEQAQFAPAAPAADPKATTDEAARLLAAVDEEVRGPWSVVGSRC